MTTSYKINYQSVSNRSGESVDTFYVDDPRLVAGILAHWNSRASLGKGMREMGYRYFQTDAQVGVAEPVNVPAMTFIYTNTQGGYLAN